MEPPAASPPDPRVGNVLQERYRILSRIASGAMGVVYKGERVQLGRPVAVKFLHPWIAAQKAFLTRFDTEARAMSRLSHPNCVSVIDFGVEGSPYLVMDYVTGRTLREVMEQEPIPPERALALVRQLLAGLAHAHAQGIIHRDLKPENVVLNADEGLGDHLRILDFGLAKLRDGPAMTAGLAVGTPSYMSPEQTGAEGGIDARTDLYAVGVLLFELLAGQKPFVSEKIGDLILMHRETPPPRLRDVAPAVGYSAEIEAVILKAMAKFADQRFQSAAAFAAAIDASPEGRGAARPGAAAAIPAANAGGPARGRPQAAADATVIDSPSAIQRILEEAPTAHATPQMAAGAGGGAAARARKALAGLDRRLVWGGVGLVGAVALAVVLGVTARRGAGGEGAATVAGAPAPGAGAAGKPSAAPGAPVAGEDPRLEEARRMVARGEWESAAAVLNRVRADDPDNAEAAYLLATVYLDNKRWADGVAAAQVAVRKNPALRSDPDLIKAVIRSLVSDRSYDRSQAFLRGLGAAASPFLREAARRDESPKVRERAAEILQGGGGRSAWGSSSSSTSGGGSMFRR